MALQRLKNKIRGKFSNVSIITYVLVVIFGSGSWLSVNGLWVELPIIVQKIPENWSLPSYLTVIIQMANIAPLMFTIGNKFFPGVIREIPIIYICVAIGGTSCALMALFWKETTFIAGAERSTALLVLCFFVAMVDCSSSVTFLPYMAIFRKVYMSPYFAGQGLSGLLPSLVALLQGVGSGAHTSHCVIPTSHLPNATNGTSSNITAGGSSGNGPKFSAEVFFWFLSGMMLACFLAFFGLNNLTVAKRQKVHQDYQGDDGFSATGEQAMELVSVHEQEGENALEYDDQVEALSGRDTLLQFAMVALVSGLSNGVIPAIQSYACIPYSYYIYHLTLTLSNMVNPVTCFVFPFISTTSTFHLILLSSAYFGMCTYIVFIASQSPMVLLRCENTGAILIVVISVSAFAIATYVKVAIGAVMREKGRKHLLWFGVCTQVGSCIGALSMFAPVNVYKFFKTY